MTDGTTSVPSVLGCSPESLFRRFVEVTGTDLERGAARRFSAAHVLHALCLCAEGRVSRQTITDAVGVGEGSVRTILTCLRNLGLVRSDKRGTAITPKGTALVGYTGIEIPAEQPARRPGRDAEYVLLARGKGHLMDNDILYRDGAVVVGATACVPFRMDGGRAHSPYCESAGIRHPDLAPLAESIGMEDGDAAVLCTARTLQAAASSAFGGMMKLLSRENRPHPGS